MKALLRGGPCDGEIVEVLGCECRRRFLIRLYSGFARRTWDAVYTWGQDGKKFIGVFKGYFNGNRRCRKDGTRMPRKAGNR